jgi:hypothetical protein
LEAVIISDHRAHPMDRTMDERSRASEVDAFQKVRNGMISLDFSSTACWTGTSPLRGGDRHQIADCQAG